MNKSSHMPGVILVVLLFTGVHFGQGLGKGIDNQTQTIKAEANKTTTRQSGEPPARQFDWGKGKTQVRDRLPNPYRLTSRRDVLVETIRQALKERKMVVDEASSRISDGIIVTQPYVFSKGPVITQNELNRYAQLSFGDTAWSRGQYSLMIEVQSIDGMQNNVLVNAKVEGRAGNGMTSEWITVQSSGLAEEEFLIKLVEMVTGASPDDPKPTDQ
jgi:hypothetical protein